MSDTLKFPGDIDVSSINIVSRTGHLVSVDSMVVLIELFEDIFSPVRSGQITLRDSHEVHNILPIVGEEVISFNLKTPGLTTSTSGDDEFKCIFAIYKMSGKIQLSDGNVGYILYFMSRDGLIDMNRKISKPFAGIVASEYKDDYTNKDACLVEKIIGDPKLLGNVDEKKVYIEPAESKIQYVSNFWGPFRNLNYLAESTVSKLNSSPTFVFFENADGYNFVSLELLYTGDVFQTFIIDKNNDPLPQDMTKEYQKIIEYDASRVSNYISNAQGGMYGSEIISFDPTAKQYMHVGYKSPFDKTTHLNSKDNKTSEPPAYRKSMQFGIPKAFNNFTDYGDVSNVKHMQNRLSLMKAAESGRLKITVYGRFDYTIGRVVEVKLPVMTEIRSTTSDTRNKAASGKYLIAAICHRITKQKHYCVMELIKDSYMNSAEESWYSP